MNTHDFKEPGWMKQLSRLGYLSKGVVYLMIGLVAMKGGANADKQQALGDIARQPFGKTLLSITAVGLLAYALWRLISGLVDPHDRADDDAKGMVKRVVYVGSSVLYFALSWSAARIVLGVGGGDGDQSADWTARLLAMPWGRVLVAMVAVGMFAGAAYQFRKALTAGFQEEFRMKSMSSTELKWATLAGRIGHVARAVVYAVIGWFFVLAALNHNAEEAGGLAKVLGTLRQQPFGQGLLFAAGAGLVCYGIYCLVAARYRRSDA